MRPGKGMLKVSSWILVIAVLAAFLPANVSAHPLDLSGVGRFGQKMAKIAGDAGKTLSELKINLAADVQKITTPTPTTKPPVKPEVVQKITSDVDPDKDNQLRSPSGKITLTVPKGAISKASQIEFSEYAPVATSGKVMLSRFSLTAKEKVSGAAFSKFNQNLQISIQHNTGDLDGVDPASVRLYYQDEKTRQWVPVAASKYDSKTNTVSGPTDHFSNYSEQGNPLIVGPGKVMAAQVGLQSGAATFSYPIDLPAGPGGFQPKLVLSYNSASVDEMKNKQDVGSWVGIGWTLNVGSISVGSDSANLDLNGVSYKIVTGNGTDYYTVPDQHLRITHFGGAWSVYDKDGNYYQFGGTTDSQQSIGTSGSVYRSDMNLMRDTNSNQATVTYHQDIMGTGLNTWVRSAYPTAMTYGNIQISFTADYDENDTTDGYLRYDDPKTCNQDPPPKIFENRKLTALEIKVSNNLLRKYNFTYATVNRSLSTDYGGIYYAGALKLQSITQVGADGTSTLPAMTFDYTSTCQTGVQPSVGATYVGNPGNPASFNWPHLNVVNSGYGGSSTFTYTQKPAAGTADIWTREVITTKATNPGTGSTQTTTYNYTGDPQYLMNNGNVWDAVYRGFSQVRETDAGGNYVQHFFNTVNPADSNAEKLTGLETQTQWYASNGTLLKTVQNQWGYENAANVYDYQQKWGSWTPDGWFNAGFCSTTSGDGYIYVLDPVSSCIQKFTNNGTFVLKWGSYGTGDGQFQRPMGIATDTGGNVYVADTMNRRIQKFTPNGSFIAKWSTGIVYIAYITVASDGYIYATGGQDCIIQLTSDGVWTECWGGHSYDEGGNDLSYIGCLGGIAVSNDGAFVYVTDKMFNLVYKYHSSGNINNSFGTPVGEWGSQGNGNGQFNSPTRMTVDSNGYIYITDSGNQRIEKFSGSGTYVSQWGSSGSGDGQFNNPSSLSVDGSGYIYVADSGNNRIQKFNSSGTYIAKWGASGAPVAGQFCGVKDVATDNNGYIYLIGHNCILKLDSSGTVVTQWGSAGNGDGQFNSPDGIAISGDGYVYVADTYNNRIQKFTNTGTFVTKWGSYASVYVIGSYGQFNTPMGIAAGSDGYIYVADTYNQRIQKFTNNGTYVTSWGASMPYSIAVTCAGIVYACVTCNRIQVFTNTGGGGNYMGQSGSAPGQFSGASGIAVSSDGIFVADSNNNRVQKFNITLWGSLGSGDGQFNLPYGIAVDSNDNVYVADSGNNRIQKFQRAYTTKLQEVDTTIGSKTTRTRYSYDSNGNIITEYDDGDTSTNADDSTIWRLYYPNTDANILGKPARERVYATSVTTDNGGANLKKETYYYYDGNNTYTYGDTGWQCPPGIGRVTRVESMTNATGSVSTYTTYDTYGNILTSTDANANVTSTTWETTYHTYPVTKIYPITSLTESYTYDPGTNNLLTQTDVNGQVTSYYYDTFKRLTSVVKPGDSQGSPGITYQYNNWGTLNSQNVKTINKIDASNSIWKADYFDGLGRVIQSQAQSETSGHTIISGTTTYNTCGQVDKQYLVQDIAANLSAYYNTGISGWKYSSYTYDGLGRGLVQTNPDGTAASNDYTTPWQTNVTNTRGLISRNFYDAFDRLVQVQEPNSDNTVYATTNYTYDILGNLTQVQDAAGNSTNMYYSEGTEPGKNLLSRKYKMVDPDMGTWYYFYDPAGNLKAQVDAKSQATNLYYDAMNRLKGKTYTTGVQFPYNYESYRPGDPGTYTVGYTYDSTANGNLGKGLRTGMTDAAGTTADKYDTRGRLIEEKKTIDAVDYTTSYTYDGLDRAVTVTYPTGETVTNTFNGRGLPNAVTGSVAGNFVTGTLYNTLGSITQINLGNNLKTNYSYWGIDHSTTSYGKLWEIKTQPQAGGTAIQDMQYTWDAIGNLTQRVNTVSSETENFTYDSVDRLTGVSGAYTQSYFYNAIGNITAMNGTNYTYGDTNHKHAVTAVGTTNYAYDANGNMTTRGAQTITWDVENRPLTVTGGATFVYDGDGNRVKKTEGGQTILYINQYYEKNITTGVVTTSYFIGGQLVATREGTTLRYVHQDSLGSTSTMSASDGTAISSIAYFPFGLTRTGSINTTKEFTGQRLDSTGLYYYNARYYDPQIGRFISPDSVGQRLDDPQTLNRYSYCSNNPLKYTDPSGHSFGSFIKSCVNFAAAHPVIAAVAVVLVVSAAIIAAPVVLSAISTAAAVAAASTTGAIASAAIGVEITAASAATVMFPIAADVAAIPVLGEIATTIANVGLSYIGLGTYNPKLANPTLCPENPTEMNDIVGVKPVSIPDGPNSPGRNKVEWQLDGGLKVSYENHSYDPTGGPINHVDNHYHFVTPDDGYSPGYLPGEPIPSYFWDWLY